MLRPQPDQHDAVAHGKFAEPLRGLCQAQLTAGECRGHHFFLADPSQDYMLPIVCFLVFPAGPFVSRKPDQAIVPRHRSGPLAPVR